MAGALIITRRATLADIVADRATGALLPYRDAVAAYGDHRTSLGMRTARAPLTTVPDGNAKVRKGLAKGLPPTWGLTLAPARDANVGNACPHATRECLAACLQTSGRLGMSQARAARVARTSFLAAAPDAALSLVWWEVTRAARATGGPVGFRPNVLSDLPWETLAPYWWDAWRSAGVDVRVYDYTKAWTRDPRPAVAKGRYRLTYSASERTSDDDVAAALADGRNVALVVDVPKGHRWPTRWRGAPVIDGDISDWRYSDRRGALVALYAKGRARGTGRPGGFVRDAESFGAGIDR